MLFEKKINTAFVWQFGDQLLENQLLAYPKSTFQG